ncbi:MAG: hypothetical protein IKD45_02940 [Clostridia bacterium]|nr:hypothetical protein [Clostridia bacterium]
MNKCKTHKEYIKRRVIFLSLLAALLTVSVIASLFALRTGAASDGTPESEGEASAHIWRITHADGTTEYSDSFSGAFSSMSEGDVFKFLPKEYYLYKKDFASVKPSVNITIDLRGSVIYAPEIGDLNFNPSIGEVNAQMLSISSKNGSHVDVLLEGAEIYAPLGGRCAFSVSGDTTVSFDGGEAGGKIFAPGALNLTSNCSDPEAWSYMRNLYVYKSSVNMAGCVCARESAKLRLIDCTVIAPSGGNLPLLLRNSAKMVLDNTFAASLGGGNAIEISQVASGMEFSVLGGSAVYGKLKGAELGASINIHPASYFTEDVSAYASVTPVSVSLEHNYFSSVGTKTDVPGLTVQEYRYTSGEKTETFSFSYAVTERNDTTKVHISGYPWKLTDANGSSVYSKTLAPLALPHSYNKVELVENFVGRYTSVLLLSSDLKLILGKDITLSADADISNLFVTRGGGTASVEISGNISVPTVNLIFAHDGAVSVRGNGFPSGFTVGSLAFADTGDVTVSDIDIYSASGRVAASLRGSVFIYTSTVYSDALSARNIRTVYGGKDVSVKNSEIIAPVHLCAIGAGEKLTLEGTVYVSGGISSGRIVTSDFCFFTEPPITIEDNSTVIADTVTTELSVMSSTGNFALTLTFVYKTEPYTLDNEQSASSVWRLEFKDGSVKYTKHLYVPFSYASEYTSMTLLQDTAFSAGVSLDMEGDVTVSLAGRKITAEGKLTSGVPLFTAAGDGKLTLKLSDSVILLSDATLLELNDIHSAHLDAEGAYVEGSSLIAAKGTDISVYGGFFSVRGAAINAAGGKVEITGATLFASDIGTLISSYADISLFDGTRLLASTGSNAINTEKILYLASDVMVFGTVKAERISAGEGAYLSYLPKNMECNMPSRTERNSLALPVLSYENGEIKESVKKYIFSYRLLPIESGLAVSLAFDDAAGLNIYVPRSVANGDFILRVMLNGVLYSATAENAERVTASGTEYMRFGYRYMYPETYGKELTVTLISGSFVKVMTTTPERILADSFAAASEDAKTVIAAYASLASAASGIKLPEDSELTGYIPKHRDAECDTSALRKYISYLSYDVLSHTLALGIKGDAASLLHATYTFDGYTLNSDTGGGKTALSLNIYRVAPDSEIILTVTDIGGETAIISTDLYTLSAFAADGGTADTYLSLILAYHEARGAKSREQ